MNKPLLLSILAITSTMVIGFTSLIFYTQAKPVKGDSAKTDISAEVKKSDHPYLPPSIDELPDGEEKDLIKLGEKYHNETSSALDGYVGNTLSCASCHANGGIDGSLDLVGISKTYPMYNSRAGREVTIEERINGCFVRSMNGKPLPPEGEEMKAMVAYYEYISQNVPDGTTERPWAKLERAKGDLTAVNIDEGRELYNKACISCHGEGGTGGPTGLALWGENSYNIGAGMARIRTSAGFIQQYMPKAPMGGYEAGTFTEEEAMNIAAYINSMERPDFEKKIYDWPNGDAPDDAAYETLAGKKDSSDK